MSEEVLTEDQSHYEISLTAGQAFLAFVLLLLSLAASFAFGLVIGKGQMDDKLIAKRESAAVVNEAQVVPAKKKVIELPVEADEFKTTLTEDAAAPAPAARIGGAPLTPAYAQLLSSSDQKVAEGLAAKLIDAGFMSAYVERSAGDKGTTYRVRVKFASDAEARAAEAKLREFSKEVWITSK